MTSKTDEMGVVEVELKPFHIGIWH